MKITNYNYVSTHIHILCTFVVVGQFPCSSSERIVARENACSHTSGRHGRFGKLIPEEDRKLLSPDSTSRLRNITDRENEKKTDDSL